MAKTKEQLEAEIAGMTKSQRMKLAQSLKTQAGQQEVQQFRQAQAPITPTMDGMSKQQPLPQNQPVSQPVQQPTQPVVQQPTMGTPKAPETPKVEQPQTITKDTMWSDVKDKSPTNLEQLIEARYGTVATQQDGKITAQIGDKNFQWSLDAQ